MKKVEESERTSMEEFRRYRDVYIDEIIRRVQSEQNDDETEYQDYVDTAIANYDRVGDNNFVCSECNHVYCAGSYVRSCPSCGHDPNHYDTGYDPYFRTPPYHPDTPPTITVGEPCMVKEVRKLQHVQEHTLTCEGRKWTIVWCDAIPYLLGCQLQDDCYTCLTCRAELLKSELEEHTHTHTLKKTFGNLLFRPGHGHIELNMARAIIKLGWEPIVSHISKK